MGFECSQDTKDIYLLQSIKLFFGVGNIYQDRNISRIRISQVLHLQHIVIPFFSQYSVQGFKEKQYQL
jgi:hypothetical protein